MSNDTNNGGPAFPLPVEDLQCRFRFESGYGGMTLRDYFAAKAMQSLISKHGFISDEINFAAEHSYEIADAMLKAREASND
jgi:hypothetical protein